MALPTYEHPTEGFSIPVPSGWQELDPVEGIALVVAEPERPPWFRATVVVTVDELDPGSGLAEWADESTRALEETLADLLVIDVERIAIAGHPARRTLAHHDAGGHAVTLEQWAVHAGTRGYVISASVGTLDYDAYADVVAEMAAGFRPVE